MVKNVWLLSGLPNLAIKTYETQTKVFEKLNVRISVVPYSDNIWILYKKFEFLMVEPFEI